MDIQGKVTAIVPTYNEAERIAEVLKALMGCPYFKEIIVVDDGSQDHTLQIVQNYPVRYLRLPLNRGKGYAMERGVHEAKSEVIFFADADVTGLDQSILDQIIQPVVRGEVEMFIGMRGRKIFFLQPLALIIPHLGGERALTKKLWDTLPPYYKHRFRVEIGLNFYAHYYGKGFKIKIMKNLSHKIKEKKYGLLKGFNQRLRMGGDLLSAQCRLYFRDLPQTAKYQGKLGLKALGNLGGVGLGGIFLRGGLLDLPFYFTSSAIDTTLVALGAFFLSDSLLHFLAQLPLLKKLLKIRIRELKGRMA